MIVSAGLTPAVSQIMEFASFREGEVNRARAVQWSAAGKSVNVGIALASLDRSTVTIAPVGGHSGELLKAALSRLRVPYRFTNTRTRTRICTTILSRDGTTTELVEEAGPLTRRELDDFKRLWIRCAKRARVVVISGSMPPGTGVNFYHTMIRELDGHAILDVRGPELLAALKARPFIVKPNREELARTIGRTLKTERDVFRAMHELNTQGAQWVVISQGGRAVLVSSLEKRYRFASLKTVVVNPIGAGDYMTAGIAWSISKGRTVPDAVRFGIAAATMKVQHRSPPALTAKALDKLSTRVVVTELANFH
jgi:1-phosphofructokinase family hexose kinase